MKYLHGARHFLMAFCVLALTSLLIQPETADARGAQTATGLLTFARQVTINGTEAAAGQTIFSGSRVQVGPGGTAVLSLGALGRIELGGGAEFTLRLAANTLGGDLLIGCMSLSAPARVAVLVNSNQGPITADGSQATAFWLGYKDGAARVIPTIGEIRTTSGTQTEAAKPGDLLTISTTPAGARNMQRRPAAECGQTTGATCACAPAALPRTSSPTSRGTRTASASSSQAANTALMVGSIVISGATFGYTISRDANGGVTCRDNSGGLACNQVSPITQGFQTQSSPPPPPLPSGSPQP